ncbi:MAG: hypothetical protein IPM98_12585 [Lewinellaceae bacterium]|nr:hypothetical protein [Lewinellaceae bacterium]
MDDLFLQSLGRRLGLPDSLEEHLGRLAASDVNAFLLEVFHRQAGKVTPHALLAAYRKNQMMQPSAVDAVAFREFELRWLKAGREVGFQPLELSPVAPLGSCSAVGTVHQHKVLSALRGAEVVADCTNIMALEAGLRRHAAGFPTAPVQLCAAHRHLRTQQINTPGFTPHFGVFCLTTAGRDTGSFLFEKENIARHIGFYLHALREMAEKPNLTIVLKSLDPDSGPNRVFDAVSEYIRQQFPETPTAVQHLPQAQQQYYRALQFGIVWERNGKAFPIIDGGLTDWTQKLTSNRKERFLGSGIGLEFVWKIQNRQIG